MPFPTFYFPGKRFPSVSVTGASCALSCKHCNAHYLRGMIECSEPEELEALAYKLVQKGANGFLLSGGCDVEGRVPLDEFYPVIGRIKRSTDLLINLHVGLLKSKDAGRIREAGVDTVSVEVIGDDDTIKEVYNLDATVADYEIMLERLAAESIEVVPHVTAGLHFGRLRGEERALEVMNTIRPRTVVVNALIPTKGTPMEGMRGSDEAYLSVLSSARKRFPDARILMGCMRPRDSRIEQKALKMGVDGIVNPRRKTIGEHRHVRSGLCCAIRE